MNKNLWPSLHLTDLDKMYSITRYILPFISPTRAHVSVFQSLILPPRHPDITTFSPRNYSFSIFHSFIHLILPPRHPDITTFSSRFYTFNPYFIHVFIQSFIHHFIYSFIVFFFKYSIINLFIYLFTILLIYSFVYVFIH